MYPGATALPFTGINVGWQIVAAVTLLSLGAAVMRLAPKMKFFRKH